MVALMFSRRRSRKATAHKERTSDLKILGISGSLRKDSYNTAVLRAAQAVVPEGVELEVFTLDGIPMYNSDEEAQHGFPPQVALLREKMAAADALLIATPEYNYSITGALKNALDWASRGGLDSPLTRKPAAILGAGGRLGTVRAQMHLRQILLHNDVPIVQKPEVFIDRAFEKFDEGGRLVHERHLDQIKRLIASLIRLAGQETL